MQKLKSVQVDRLAHNNLCNCEQKSLLARDARFLYSALFSREKRHRQCGAFGGDKGIRTPDLYVANVSRYQLCYIPEFIINFNSVT